MTIDCLKNHVAVGPEEPFLGRTRRAVTYDGVPIGYYGDRLTEDEIITHAAHTLQEKGVRVDMSLDEVRWLTRDARGEITSTDGMVGAMHELVTTIARGSSYFAYPHRDQAVRDFCDGVLRQVLSHLNSDDLECLGMHVNRDTPYDIARKVAWTVLGDVNRPDVAARRETFQADLKRHRERQV